MPDTVLGEGESIALTLSIDAFDQATVGYQDVDSTELTFRTDQSNAFGFGPIAVEEGYTFFRANPPGLGTQVQPLSREFAFNIVAAVPEPSSLVLLFSGLLTIGFLRRRKTV